MNEEKCATSADHRGTLLRDFPQLWSSHSEATKDPSACHNCNYFRRSHPWSHLIWADDLRRTFPEPFFQTELNRIAPQQLKWFVQEAVFNILEQQRSWIANPVPSELAYSFGSENLSTFTLTLRLQHFVEALSKDRGFNGPTDRSQ